MRVTRGDDMDMTDEVRTLIETAIGSAVLLEALAGDDETGAALRVVALALEDAARAARD